MLLEPRVSASMVLYHSGEKAVRAAACVTASTIPVQLHVVDNSGEPETLGQIRAVCPDAILHEPGKNLGYGGGNNLAINLVRSTYHLILNPDITFEPQLLERMVAYMDAHPDIAVLSPRLFFADGNEQYVPRMQPTLRSLLARPLQKRFRFAVRWRDAYTLRRQVLSEPLQITFASGCFLLARTHTLFRVGGFDERFFLYHEDSDLSRRILKHGAIVYHPDFTVTHQWERSSARQWKARMHHIRSTIRYFNKWGWRW